MNYLDGFRLAKIAVKPTQMALSWHIPVFKRLAISVPMLRNGVTSSIHSPQIMGSGPPGGK
jgi:hypothetical protein